MPNDEETIRGARVQDSAAIADLAAELGYPTDAAEMRRRIERLLQSDAYFLAVAERDARLIGWVAAERRLLLESGDRAEVVGLIVSADARRAGTGMRLVAAAEEWAIRQGFQSISVRSNVVRLESHPFYEKLGYVRTKTQHAYVKRLRG